MYQSINEALRRQLERFGTRHELKGIIFTHRQADPDALCSAGALMLLLKKSFLDYKLEFRIVVPQGASMLGKRISTALGIEFAEEIEKDSVLKADIIIVVDTGDPKLLEPYSALFDESSARKILIDHHVSSSLPETWKNLDEQIVSPESTSACEIVALGFPSEIFSKKIADTLLLGLLFDSQHFGIATKRTLRAALTLVEAGSDISASKRLLRYEPDRSEILGRIKAAQRMKYEECSGKIITTSEISSFHATVARMLVEIGADVGIAYGESNGEGRLSARSSQSFYKETGIDLAVETKKIADRFSIVGGGHSTAASISGKIDAEILASSLVQNLKSTLLKK